MTIVKASNWSPNTSISTKHEIIIQPGNTFSTFVINPARKTFCQNLSHMKLLSHIKFRTKDVNHYVEILAANRRDEIDAVFGTLIGTPIQMTQSSRNNGTQFSTAKH
jgi:hypothetical protein